MIITYCVATTELVSIEQTGPLWSCMYFYSPIYLSDTVVYAAFGVYDQKQYV